MVICRVSVGVTVGLCAVCASSDGRLDMRLRSRVDGDHLVSVLDSFCRFVRTHFSEGGRREVVYRAGSEESRPVCSVLGFAF